MLKRNWIDALTKKLPCRFEFGILLQSTGSYYKMYSSKCVYVRSLVQYTSGPSGDNVTFSLKVHIILPLKLRHWNFGFFTGVPPLITKYSWVRGHWISRTIQSERLCADHFNKWSYRSMLVRRSECQGLLSRRNLR